MRSSPLGVSAVLSSILQLLGCVDESVDERSRLTVWRHEPGRVELAASLGAFERFRALHPQVELTIETLPQVSYTEAITAAALAGTLPCVIDVDQPAVPNFAWTGHLRPLDDLLDPGLTASLLDGAKSSYAGQLFAIGPFDVVLALFARRSDLDRLGIRVATLSQPYGLEEFERALSLAATSTGVRYPLDLNTVHRGEWMSYAFGPWLQSGGADLIDRSHYLEAEGVLNGSEAFDVASWYQKVFSKNWADPNATDDRSLPRGESILHYTGSWVAERYAERFGEDLVIMPPPDFGNGPRVGSGSWQWGITRACPEPELAAELIAFLHSPSEISSMSEATGFIPTSSAAAALTTRFRPGEPWRVFYEMLSTMSVPRPATPGYPVISSAVERAFFNIKSGSPVQEALDDAVDTIEQDIARNRGYGFSEELR